MQTEEALLDLGILEARPSRRDSFVDLMAVCPTFFPDYEAAEQFSGLLLDPPSDSESTASSFKEELRLPKTCRKPRKKHLQAPAAIVEIVVVRRQVGLISVEERQAKIERYLEKRKRRLWGKRISYDCRKRVADGRLRFKGRFIAKPSLQAACLPAETEREVDPQDLDLGYLLSN